MKKSKTIAAVLFGVLAIVQIFGLSFVFSTTTAQLPVITFLEIAALVVYALVCVKMLKTADVAVTSGEKRAAAALSVIYLMAIAFNIQIVIQVLMLAFAMVSQELAQVQTTGIVMLCVRTAILIAALYFTFCNEKIKNSEVLIDSLVSERELSEDNTLD